MSLLSRVWPYRCNRLFVCFVVSAIVLSLLLPTTLLPGGTKVSAKPKWPQYMPISAPPQPFHTGGSFSGPSTSIAAVTMGAISGLGELLRPQNGWGEMVLNQPRLYAVNFIGAVTSFLGLSIPLSEEATVVVAPAAAAAPFLPAANITFDFDGDGKADIGRWHSTGREFKVKKSNGTGFLTSIVGTSASRAAPGDFDGNGTTDAAVFSAGTWYISFTGGTTTTISLGTTGDIPAAGDYDGDGTTDAAVFRPSTGVWYVKQSSNGVTFNTTFGEAGDIPVAGDYDGDDKTDIAVFRPSTTGFWYILKSSDSSVMYIPWGMATDHVRVVDTEKL